MAQITIPNLGPLKNGFSRNPSLKPKILSDGPMNGPTGCGWPPRQAPKPQYWGSLSIAQSHFFQAPYGNLPVSTGPCCPRATKTTINVFWPMLRAQIGQSVVLKTPTKLQHPYCKSFGAIAIGKLHLALLIRNVSLSRKFETSRKSTLRTRRYPHLSIPDFE